MFAIQLATFWYRFIILHTIVGKIKKLCFTYFTLVTFLYKEYDKKSITYEIVTSKKFTKHSGWEGTFFWQPWGWVSFKSICTFMTYNLITYTKNIIYVLFAGDLLIPVIWYGYIIIYIYYKVIRLFIIIGYSFLYIILFDYT